MKSIIIHENERGFLFKNGKYVKTLQAGKYNLFGGRKVEVAAIERGITCNRCTLDTLLADPNFASQVAVTEVGNEQLVIHYVNGKYAGVMTQQGKYAFWNEHGKHEFMPINISTPEVKEDIPRYIFDKLSTNYYVKVEVKDYQKALLYYDNKLVKILEPGIFYFWKTNTKVTVSYVDTRLRQLNISGQEIMTQDKVSLRINVVCNYRVTDYVKILTEIDDFEEQIHVAAQLAIRDYVGKYKLDEILESKDALSKYVFERLKEKEGDLYVEFKNAGVKDIILPGDIRDIMNTVLVAEKKAQANVITRREEVASTRSLLNTAKLMDENQTLYKLKELEYIDSICKKIGSINLNGSSDMLTQLLGMVGDRKTGT